MLPLVWLVNGWVGKLKKFAVAGQKEFEFMTYSHKKMKYIW